VEATESQSKPNPPVTAVLIRLAVRQNATKAPHIIRRPSRIIAVPTNPRLAPPGPAQRGLPGIRPPYSQNTSGGLSSTSMSLSTSMIGGAEGSSAMKGSVGLSSALSKPVLLRVKVTASADVHFTTTISV
jgi:hypothetical protein